MGQSKGQKEYNKTMAANAKEDRKLQREMFDASKQPTAGQRRFEEGAANWDEFIKSRNYGKPPKTSMLNFDLMTPARMQKLRAGFAQLEGVGAAAMDGDGDRSIAIQQTRENMANQAAIEAGASYENAVKQEDAYWKGSGFQWAGLDINKNLNLLQNATGSSQFFFEQQRQSLPPSFMQTWGPLFGAALGAAGSALSGGFAAGGTFGKPK